MATIESIVLGLSTNFDPDGVELIVSILNNFLSSGSLQKLPDDLRRIITAQASRHGNYHLIEIRVLAQEIILAARRLNGFRNKIMHTQDRVDSYDVGRGIFFNPMIRDILKIPTFPYQTDPDPALTRSINPQLTPGARAALTAYYKTYIQNVNRLSPEDINFSLTAMGLTPTARSEIGKELLVTEVERRINRTIASMSGKQINFLDLIKILEHISFS